MEIKFKGLNKNECYACGITDLKKVFAPTEDLFVSFGYLGRYYSYDSKFIKRPHIDGFVISQLEINHRLHVDGASPILSFYVIRDSRYTDNHRRIFKQSVLPKMREWYQKILMPQNIINPGVDALLIEYTEENFKFHFC